MSSNNILKLDTSEDNIKLRTSRIRSGSDEEDSEPTSIENISI